jgi:hypothetical protein
MASGSAYTERTDTSSSCPKHCVTGCVESLHAAWRDPARTDTIARAGFCYRSMTASEDVWAAGNAYEPYVG